MLAGEWDDKEMDSSNGYGTGRSVHLYVQITVVLVPKLQQTVIRVNIWFSLC